MRPLIVALALSLSACAATQQAAVELTKRDLAKHGLPLPRNYHTDIVEGFELISYTYRGDLYQLYTVSYSADGKVLYKFTVERYTGKIRKFQDMRSAARPAS